MQTRVKKKKRKKEMKTCYLQIKIMRNEKVAVHIINGYDLHMHNAVVMELLM